MLFGVGWEKGIRLGWGKGAHWVHIIFSYFSHFSIQREDGMMEIAPCRQTNL